MLATLNMIGGSLQHGSLEGRVFDSKLSLRSFFHEQHRAHSVEGIRLNSSFIKNLSRYITQETTASLSRGGMRL